MPNRSSEHKVVVNYNTKLTMLPVGTSALYLPDGTYLGVATHTDGETTLVTDSGVYHCMNSGVLSLNGVLRPYSMEVTTTRRTRVQSNIFANYVNWGDGKIDYGTNYHMYNTFKTHHVTMKGTARSYDYDDIEQRNITYINLNDLGMYEDTTFYAKYIDALFIALHPGPWSLANNTFPYEEYSHDRRLFELYIPESVSTIQSDWTELDAIPNLGRVILESPYPPDIESGADRPLRLAQIFVPREAYSTYSDHPIWGSLDLHPLPEIAHGNAQLTNFFVGDLFKYPVQEPDDTLYLSMFDRLLYIPEGKHHLYVDYYDMGTIEREGSICTYTDDMGLQYSADVRHNYDI